MSAVKIAIGEGVTADFRQLSLLLVVVLPLQKPSTSFALYMHTIETTNTTRESRLVLLFDDLRQLMKFRLVFQKKGYLLG